MRAAEYFVPRTGDDKEDGECSVITFGPDKGGSVDDNVDALGEAARGGSCRRRAHSAAPCAA